MCDGGRDYYNNIYDYNIIVVINIISSAVDYDDDYRHKKQGIYTFIILKYSVYDIIISY